jgi:hypothetical protein
MNAAFAVGRVCDKEEGRHLLLSLVESEHMVNTAALQCHLNAPSIINTPFD